MRSTSNLSAIFILVSTISRPVIGQGEGDCVEGEIRLANGRTDFEGRIELCVEGSWGTVCDDGWDVNDTLVVCQQLGFNLSDITYPAYFGEGAGPILLDEVACTGTEESLLNCSFQDHDCEHSEDAGVICPSTLCEDGMVRLVDGFSQFEGRVEVCFDGVWGSVCSEDWEHNTAAATVLCKQLGIYSPLGAVPIPYHSRGLGPIFLTDISCTGKEESLGACEYEFTEAMSHFCSRPSLNSPDALDAGVHCLQGCNDTAVRLIGQRGQSSQGRLEVCLNSTWGTICNKGWDIHASLVACRQLGFSSEYAAAATSVGFPTDSAPIHFSNIKCTGDEESVLDCSAIQVSNDKNCDHSMDVSIACSRSPCTDGELRLLGGPDNQEGRVQACSGGEWKSVCGDNWNESEATVVCRQLGYTENSAFSTKYLSGEANTLSAGCLGNEPTLVDCKISNATQCVHHAGVFCSAPCYSSGHSECCESSGECLVESSTTRCFCNARCFIDGQCCSDVLYSDGCIPGDRPGCVNGEVRLYGGTSPSNGQLELCVGGHWAAVCASPSLHTAVAVLACSQLGYGDTSFLIFPSGSFHLLQVSTLSIRGLNCNGSELLISDCYYQRANSSSCQSASLACAGECAEGRVRLVGNSRLSGRVEVCSNGVWGSLYTRGWSDASARVLCKQLGQKGKGATISGVPERSGFRVCSTVSCSGGEDTLMECVGYRDISSSCVDYQLAGATCSNSSSQKGILPLSLVLVTSFTLLSALLSM